MIRQMINGICMALADSVPGVSGGTIAFILGFYDQFIGSINDLFYGKKEQRIKALIYLLKLGSGWILGMASAVLVLTSVFETHIYVVSSLFLGFIIASIPLVIHNEKSSFRENYLNTVFAVIGAGIVVAITYFNNSSILTGVSMASLSFPMMLYVFAAGMIAISAMFLPGISGSTLLLIFGLYIPVMTGLKELMHMNLSYAVGIAIFILGILTGALSVVKGLRVCLEKHRSKTMYTILGLMIGSLYAITKGPTTLETPMEAMSLHSFHLIAALVGIAIVIVLHFAGKVKEKA